MEEEIIFFIIHIIQIIVSLSFSLASKALAKSELTNLT